MLVQLLRTRLSNRLSIESGHFKSLNENVRRLLFSHGFFLAAFPLLAIFINAFFWRQTGDLRHILTYNTGWFISLPVGFYINGLLLKKIHIRSLYFIGVVAQGLGAFLAIFSANTNILNLLAYGSIYGVGAGLFWANKNYLILRLTRGSNRTYYNNIEYSIDLIINIITPAIVGWLIVAGERSGLYTATFGYRGLMFIAIGLLITSGYLVFSSKIPGMKVRKLWVDKPSVHWRNVRLLNIIYNTVIGVNYILPGILVLVLIGNEGVLGTVESAAAILTAITLYIVGRKTNIKDSWNIIVVATMLYMLTTFIFAVGFSWVTLLIFIAGSTIARPLKWTTSYTLIMETMDKEVGETNLAEQYAYVCDNELFFNIGRIFAILLIFVFLTKSQNFALRWAPFTLATIQILGFTLIKRLIKHVDKSLI